MAIYLYFYKYPSQIDILPKSIQCLSLSELERFKNPKVIFKKNQFILNRILLRQILSIHGTLSPKKWDIVIGLNGKPDLSIEQKNQQNISFNISHSNDMLLISISSEIVNLGVDIEKIKPKRNWQNISARYFHEDENSYIQEQNSHLLFYDLWCLKEAFSKSDGGTLMPNLQSTNFDLANKKKYFDHTSLNNLALYQVNNINSPKFSFLGELENEYKFSLCTDILMPIKSMFIEDALLNSILIY